VVVSLLLLLPHSLLFPSRTRSVCLSVCLSTLEQFCVLCRNGNNVYAARWRCADVRRRPRASNDQSKTRARSTPLPTPSRFFPDRLRPAPCRADPSAPVARSVGPDATCTVSVLSTSCVIASGKVPFKREMVQVVARHPSCSRPLARCQLSLQHRDRPWTDRTAVRVVYIVYRLLGPCAR